MIVPSASAFNRSDEAYPARCADGLCQRHARPRANGRRGARNSPKRPPRPASASNRDQLHFKPSKLAVAWGYS